MPNYRRACSPGGTFFFTLVTQGRRPLFTQPLALTLLREALSATRADRSFDLDAIVLLPDDLHLIMTLPANDADFSTRIGAIKGRFSRAWLREGGSESSQSVSRETKGYAGVWQKRFWENCIRDSADLDRCLDYVHYNPVKHGLSSCPHRWAWSSFARHVATNRYEANWQCTCNAKTNEPPPVNIPGAEMD